MKSKFFIFGGVVSIGFYIALLIGLYLYLQEHKHKKYLSAGDKGIAISLESQKQEPKKIEQKPTFKPKKVEKPKVEKKKPVVKPKKVEKPKPKPKPKKVEKPQPKPKPKPKPKKVEQPKPKVESVDDLFSDIKTDRPKEKKKNPIKISDKPATSSKKSSGKGEQNAYIKKLYNKLENGIPMDEQFVGSRVDVELTIYQNGDFRFQVVRYDNNTEFNEIIIAYLEQLQSIGLDSHKSSKPYRFTVELIAKE